MTRDDRAEYLASGQGDVDGSERIDLIRGLLADPVLWADTPPGLAERVAHGIGTRPAEPTPRHRGRWLVPVTVGVAAVILGLVALMNSLQGQPEPPDATAALRGTELAPNSEGSATIRDMSSGWSIRLSLRDLPPAPEGSFYQGWAWNDDGEGVSIGTFHLRNGTYPVTLWAGVDLTVYPYLRVTLQDEGAGTGVSDHVVMKGRIEGLAERR